MKGQERVGEHALVIRFMPLEQVADLVNLAAEGLQHHEFGIFMVFLAAMEVIKQ